MKKRILSIICIILLMLTITAPLGNSYFAFADDSTPSVLTDEEKCDLSLSCYYNYRKGWFSSTSSTAVIGLLRNYIQQFFYSDANTTGIESYSEFAEHITVAKNSSGYWSVSLDNTGITFLDHLVKWLLGKNEFPNLYSGGSWGSGQSSSDKVYDGALLDGNPIYIFHTTEYTGGSSFTPFNMNILEKVDVGSPVDGLSAEVLYNQYMATYPNANMHEIIWQSGEDAGGIGLNIHYSSNILFNSDYYVRNITLSSLSADMKPCLLVWYCDVPIYANRVNALRGNPAWFRTTQDPANVFRYGFITYDYTNEQYYYNIRGTYTRNDTIPYQECDVDLNTDNFDRNDVGNGTEFVPQYTTNNGDTYNNFDNDTINNFYNSYYNYYTTENTIINNNSSGGGSDPSPDDPDEPEVPGGTTPPWTDNGSSGTLTPDGNGGFNLSLPDLTIPDLDIDWSISGLKDKFPFSIPWDLLAFFTVLNAEPETPAIEAQIDLGIVNWDIDWDLHNFDTLAVLLRNLEFIGFCLALILITRSIIKG